jgi:maltose/moltooligosaccharide transporter
VRNAVCDVLVVQTSALDEDRMFAARHPAEGGARPATGAGSEGGPPTR